MKPRLVPLLLAAALAPAGALAQGTELTPDLIRQIQVDLAARGFSPGPATGQLNAQTFDALAQLQRSRAIAATGQLDARTLAVLGIARPAETSGAAPASMVGPGTTAPSGTPQGATPVRTPLPGGIAQGVPLGGATPPGMQPSTTFGGTVAGAPAPVTTTTTTTTTPITGSAPVIVATPTTPSPIISPAPSIASPTAPATATTTATIGTTTTAPAGTAAGTTSGAAAARSSGR